MTREMLKEAIADAKTIKETAIASAKSALEEAFTPQLTAMFAEKLNELEMDEEMEEESMNEMHGEEEEIDENFNLEELLAELSMEEEGQEPKMEGKDMEDKSLEEDLMLEEMSDEEIEELVMQVIDDMITSGKLMPGEGEEEGEEDMEDMEDMGSEEEMESEEEVDIDEILAEIESEEKELDEEKEPINEMTDNALMLAALATAVGVPVASFTVAKLHDMAKAGKLGDAGKKVAAFLEKAGKATSPRNTGGGEGGVTETEVTKDEMEETINELRKELNEVNLLNAKLLYTNKIFKAKNLTESEKIKVLNTFDKAETVKEVKLVFETLTESFKTTTVKKNPIKESLGSASKTISTATPKQPIIETNEAFARMQRLAGLKK